MLTVFCLSIVGTGLALPGHFDQCESLDPDVQRQCVGWADDDALGDQRSMQVIVTDEDLSVEDIDEESVEQMDHTSEANLRSINETAGMQSGHVLNHPTVPPTPPPTAACHVDTPTSYRSCLSHWEQGYCNYMAPTNRRRRRYGRDAESNCGATCWEEFGCQAPMCSADADCAGIHVCGKHGVCEKAPGIGVCGSLVPISTSDCPINADIGNCDKVPYGAFCEGDGECGTDGSMGNCGAFDVYQKTDPAAPVSSVGDPHMTNILGQRFDLNRPGTHVLVRLPKDANHDGLLLEISCDVERMSASCADMYIQRLNLTGAWLEEKGTRMLAYSAQSGEVDKGWQKIGRIEVKVARGITKEGVKYLNMFTKHLSKTGLRVGGLLGEDDHTTAATPMADCRQMMSL